MKDYIKFYKYDADYQAAKPNLPEPHAVYCWETNVVDISAPVFNEKQYLAFKAVDGDATLTITNVGGAAPQLYWSYDQVEWTDWTASGYSELTIIDGKKVYLKGDNDTFYHSYNKYSMFGGSGKYEVSGSISSLLDNDNIYGNLDRVSVRECFKLLFQKNIQIIKIDIESPYNNLYDELFSYMFDGCISIIEAKINISGKLNKLVNTFSRTFNGCTSLSSALIILPDSLTNTCSTYEGYAGFYHTFYGCTSLSSASIILPDSLTDVYMPYTFYGCTSLINQPFTIPSSVTSINLSSCFYGCTSLTNMYLNINDICTNLNLSSCFYGCKSLINQPFTIPSSVTSIHLYSCFYGCKSLSSASIILPDSLQPSSSTASFYSCFSNCYALTTAYIKIPDNIINVHSQFFNNMFSGCTKLTNLVIEYHPPYSSICNQWLYRVPNQSSNIFRIYQEDEAAWPRSESGIPTNFTIEYLD